MSRRLVDEVHVQNSAIYSPSPPAQIRDPRQLGGLLDRPTFADHLHRAVLRNQGLGGGLALLEVVLDPVVTTNVGDASATQAEVRIVAAGRLIACLHRTYVTAWIATDKFVVLAEGVRDLESAADLAEQLLLAVGWPSILPDGPNQITASIGIALQGPRTSAQQLLNSADIAMYSARSAGGNRFRLFQEWMLESSAIPADR